MAARAMTIHEPDAEVRFPFALDLDYAAILATSERVAWTVDRVFRHRRFDSTRSIVPSAWVGIDGLEFLTARDWLVLNQCRAFSYAHLLGNFEEFLPQHLVEVAAGEWHGDRARLRELLRFGDEEIKHQQLFARTEQVLEESCGYVFGRHFDVAGTAAAALSEATLHHAPLPRFLIVLALECGTQRHFIESIQDRGGDRSDPLYIDVLKAHWVEEAQHVKADLIEIARLAADLTEPELAAAFDELLAIAALVDQAFAGQAACEIETLARITGRAFEKPEKERLHAALYRSLAEIMAGVGLSHATFARVARDLSVEGAAKLGIIAAA